MLNLSKSAPTIPEEQLNVFNNGKTHLFNSTWAFKKKEKEKVECSIKASYKSESDINLVYWSLNNLSMLFVGLSPTGVQTMSLSHHQIMIQ